MQITAAGARRAAKLALIFSLTLSVFPQVLLDQSFESNGDNAFIANDLQTVVQTFTPSYSGYLESVELQVARDPLVTADLILQILTTLPDQTPSENLLLELAIPASQVQEGDASLAFGFDRFQLPAGAVPVKEGEMLAIALKSPARGTINLSPYGWRFSESDYERGMAFTRASDSEFSPVTNHDFGFRTYVAVPEPSIISLCALGALFFIRLSRRRG